MPTIFEILSTAAQHFNDGRLQAAEQCCRQVLQLDPNQSDAFHLLGVIAYQVGNYAAADECIGRSVYLGGNSAELFYNLGRAKLALKRTSDAIACFRRALQIRPDYFEAYVNLGDTLQSNKELDEAIVCYQRALALKPNDGQIYNNLGVALSSRGKTSEAIASLRRAVELNPAFSGAYTNLGNILFGLGRFDDAIASYRHAAELTPDRPESHLDLGNALREQGRLNESIDCCLRAVKLNPTLAAAYIKLGNSLQDMGRVDEAISQYRRAEELQPTNSDLYNSLGNAFKKQRNLDDAANCYRRAIALQSDFAVAHNNLGAVLSDQGELDDAIISFRRAVELNPELVRAHSNLVYTQIFRPGLDSRTLLEEHRLWADQHAVPLMKSISSHRNDRDPERRLRIGYVSPDFRNHVVGRNLLPLFREHDHQQFEIYSYVDVLSPDDWTNRFRGYSDYLRHIVGASHEQVAQFVREDGIDILVDLTLHMARNRLLVFARKPAPIQVTFAGYPGTTGLKTIDYRLTDPYLDPPGVDDGSYTEGSFRLPHSFWCYDSFGDEDPYVNDLPAIQKGYVTFGCLNNFCKLNPAVLKMWAQVLRAVDSSRLILLAGLGGHRQRSLELLAAEGISGDRISFVNTQPRIEYLRTYHEIDIGLDSVPYNGHTTSLDSFWMGVPVVTLVGNTVVGRAGLCQLMNLGLPELVADSPDKFVQIAVSLAKDQSRLKELRDTLRERMRASPLMDAPGFTRSIESAYREMWRRWCNSPKLPDSMVE